jgi:hypothetical protein
VEAVSDEDLIPRAPRCRCYPVPLPVEEAAYAAELRDRAREIADQISAVLPDGLRVTWEE